MTDVTLKENIDTPAVIVDLDKMISNIKEMSRLAKVIPKIDKFTQKKTSHFYKFLG